MNYQFARPFLTWKLSTIGKISFLINYQKIMGSILYIIAFILIIGWAVGFFAYSAGSVIHILLVIAIVAILFRVISGNKSVL
jgi:hypothetical protein